MCHANSSIFKGAPYKAQQERGPGVPACHLLNLGSAHDISLWFLVQAQVRKTTDLSFSRIIRTRPDWNESYHLWRNKFRLQNNVESFSLLHDLVHSKKIRKSGFEPLTFTSRNERQPRWNMERRKKFMIASDFYWFGCNDNHGYKFLSYCCCRCCNCFCYCCCWWWRCWCCLFVFKAFSDHLENYSILVVASSVFPQRPLNKRLFFKKKRVISDIRAI